MEGWQIALIVVAGVLVFGIIAVVAWVISTYNKLIKLRNNVKESFSTMDVYMKKRYDLIPNYVETVKAYAKHENQTLEGVMKARYSCMNASTTEDRLKGENALTQTLGRLFSITENYPDLKANSNFTSLQNQLKGLEDEIANSRKYYNGCVKIYNNKIEVFPSNLVANKFKFEKSALFEVDSVEERKVPQVKF